MATLKATHGEANYTKILDLIRGAVITDGPTVLAELIESSLGIKLRRSTVRDLVQREFPERVGKSQAAAVKVAAAPATPAQINNTILMRENARLKKQLAEREAGWEIIRETLEEVYSEPLNIAVAEPKLSARPGSPEVAVFHVTDVHYGKETPTYDVATCESRMLQYFNACSEITNLRREVAPINEAVVLLGGDMIEGEGIFGHQAWETSVDLIGQMVKGGPEYCVSLLLSIAQLYPHVRVHAVPGNHGRMGHFMSPRTNADSVFFEIVRKMVQTASPSTAARIQWDLPLDRPRGAQWFSRFPIIGEWAGMLVHGDQVKGQMGYSFYGWGKKIQGWNSAKDTKGFTHCFGGHWHTHGSFDVNSVTLFATGSPESSNCYALETMGAAGEPKQRLVFLNERHGTLADYPILLS